MVWKPICFLLLAFSTAAVPELNVPKLSILSSTKTVDLTSQIVKIKVEYELKNDDKSEVNHFSHALTINENSHLSWISASESKSKTKLRIQQTSVDKEVVLYKIELLKLLTFGESISVFVEYWLTLSLKAHPAEIMQNENQYVVYQGPANIVSPYVVKKGVTNFKIGSSKLISYTNIAPCKHLSDKIVYGSYENQDPFVVKETTIHYENNAPFIVATELERIIEVSHWGNIAIEERIELVHKGAKLKGSFSRLDFQMDRRGNKQPVVKSFKTNIPRASTDIYYRDQIGNISTSMIYPRADRLELELRPRFPLFGGWKTKYAVGYNVPVSEFLNSDGATYYALKIKFFDHLYDNAFVEKLRVKIILPETSKNIKLVTPYTVKRLPDQFHKSYLDIAGRPVIVLEKENLVNQHIQPLTVYYEYDRVTLLREPIIAILAFFIFFVSVVIFFRLDFTISSLGAKEGGVSLAYATGSISAIGATTHVKKE